jgi:oxygen-independent coproporphyrinogen-3 oxidase
MKPRHLYIHVPFCVRRCAYCDFAVDAVREPPVDDWIRCVSRELALTGADLGWSGPLELRTLYIGGGTPSLLGVGAMDRLRDAIAPHVRLEDGAEWTCEANPESFTAELAADWRRSGINRLSLGAQTFHAESLRWMGRLHGPEGIGRAVAIARDAGFDNLSIDLIFGLPDRLGRDWGADLDRALELAPEHLSLYGLTAEEATPLGRWVRERRETLADEDRYADEYLLAAERMRAAGFEHYEVSNFARPGRRSVHNGAYWDGVPYAALGPGAHAYFPPVRRWNDRAWESYRTSLDRGVLPLVGEETVTSEQRLIESVWLGLRTDRGLPIDALNDAQVEQVESWVGQGWAGLEDGRIQLTPAGWLLLDRLAADLADTDEAATPIASDSRVSTDDVRPIDAAARLVQISATSNLADR